jgi:hypothetical protein
MLDSASDGILWSLMAHRTACVCHDHALQITHDLILLNTETRPVGDADGLMLRGLDSNGLLSKRSAN